MERSSGIMYASFYEAIRGLPAEDQVAAYDALFGYMFYDKEPPEDVGQIVKAICLIIKILIDIVKAICLITKILIDLDKEGVL